MNHTSTINVNKVDCTPNLIKKMARKFERKFVVSRHSLFLCLDRLLFCLFRFSSPSFSTLSKLAVGIFFSHFTDFYFMHFVQSYEEQERIFHFHKCSKKSSKELFFLPFLYYLPNNWQANTQSYFKFIILRKYCKWSVVTAAYFSQMENTPDQNMSWKNMKHFGW